MDSANSNLGGAATTVTSMRTTPIGELPKKSLPLYLSIYYRLSAKISEGALPQGAVIKEGLLTSVFDVSRAPVRRALQMLEKEKILRSAEGQGLVIGNGPQTGALSLPELKAIFLDASEPEIERAPAWESIYHNILLDVTNCIPFGTFRVNELAACEHFSIGRTALREALGKLQDNGFLEKSNRSHWTAGPLTASDIREAYEIRRLLEPAAFMRSAPSFDRPIVQAMQRRVSDTLSNLDEAAPEDIEQVENDLHRVLLENCGNRRLLEAIDKNQFPFIVGQIFRRNFGSKRDRSALEYHFLMLDQLLKKRTDVARTFLEAHLEDAEKNTLAKLRVLSILPNPETPPYLISVH